MSHRYVALSGTALAVRVMSYPFVAGAWALIFAFGLRAVLVRVGVEGVALEVIAPLVGVVAGLRVGYTNLFYILRRRRPESAVYAAASGGAKSGATVQAPVGNA